MSAVSIAAVNLPHVQAKQVRCVLQVGPRLSFTTAWSANAASICASCGLTKVVRIEPSRRLLFHSQEALSAAQRDTLAAEVGAAHASGLSVPASVAAESPPIGCLSARLCLAGRLAPSSSVRHACSSWGRLWLQALRVHDMPSDSCAQPTARSCRCTTG